MTIFFRTAIVFAIVIGCVYSFSASRRLQQLNDEKQELIKQAGQLEIEDPERVHIAAMPVGMEFSGVDQGIERIWKFRVYYPKGYRPNHFMRSREVSADSPRAGGSGSSSHQNTPLQEAKFDSITISIVKTKTGWLLNRLTDSSSGTTSLPHEMDFSKDSDLIVDAVAELHEGTKSFSNDEPICILRVREATPIKRRGRTDDDVPMYPGFYQYLVPTEAKQAFQAEMRGEGRS